MSKHLAYHIFRGSPYERGCQHGTILHSAIRSDVASMRQSISPTEWRKLENLAARSFAQLRQHAPDERHEILGIAAGSLSRPLDIYLLSAFEILTKDAVSGCTSLAVSTATGAVVAQNWDAPPHTAEKLAVMVHIDGGNEFALVASPGTLGWVGFNNRGVGFVTNDLMTDQSDEGVPSLVIRRLILKQATVRDALEVLERSQHMAGRAYLLGDATGEVGGVEVSPAGGIQMLSDRPLLHSNHPLSAISAFEDETAVTENYPSSRQRLETLRRFDRVLDDADAIEAALSNQTGTPNAIWKRYSDEEKTETAFSVIYECKTRRVRVRLGFPASGRYEILSLFGSASP